MKKILFILFVIVTVIILIKLGDAEPKDNKDMIKEAQQQREINIQSKI